MSRHRLKNSRMPRRLRHEPLESREFLTVNISPESQLLIELVNRARADPVAEIERNLAIAQADEDVDPADYVLDLNQDVDEDERISPDPKPPLAPHQALADGMDSHVRDMLARNYFGHDSPEGSTPSSRARRAGYPTGAGENIAWFGNTGSIDETEQVYSRHRGLVDSVGHRINMMRDRWLEIGPAVAFGTFMEDFKSFNAIMVGTLFGNRGGDHFITGVAITDQVVANDFYEIGEGIRGVTITASRDGTDETYSGLTGPSGGYGLQVPDGTYTVTATGGRLSRPLTVRGVVIDGENVKIDFNNRAMSTRLISGQFFEDLNNNGRNDTNEPPLANRTAFIDLNENGELDREEPRVESDASGNYFIDGLLPGTYTVRQVMPDGWNETAPFGTYVIPILSRNIIDVNFGSNVPNEAPTAQDDTANVVTGQTASIAVLQNDIDPEGELNPNTLRIQTAPRNGTARFVGTNLVYEPNEGYAGTDSVTYTVDDDNGNRSNQATVSITVTPLLPFQNPKDSLDVDDDGFIVSRDALLVINEINRNGARSLEGHARGENLPFYYDVSGDGFISSRDVLRIIESINRRIASGEPTDDIAVTSQSESTVPDSAVPDSAVPDSTVPHSSAQSSVAGASQDAAADLFFAAFANAADDDDKTNSVFLPA